MFDGKGYSENPLTGAELARLRHMTNEIAESWPSLSRLVTVVRAMAIIHDVIRVMTPIMVLATAIGAYLKFQGVF